MQNANLINASAIVNTKANTDASNFNQTGKSYLAGIGMPSTRKDVLTVLSSGSSYIAPADGFFTAGNSQGGVRLTCTNTTICVSSNLLSGIWGGNCFIPVKKGQEVIINYTNNSSNVNIVFVYAEGEKNV